LLFLLLPHALQTNHTVPEVSGQARQLPRHVMLKAPPADAGLLTDCYNPEAMVVHQVGKLWVAHDLLIQLSIALHLLCCGVPPCIAGCGASGVPGLLPLPW
jgi:hypothetical protein